MKIETLKILYRELIIHSDNGKREIPNMGYLIYEVHKMTKEPKINLIQYLNLLVEENILEKNNLTNKYYFSKKEMKSQNEIDYENLIQKMKKL
ncbi:hypothetical protein [Aureivirga sp. CE67]|uniref:hypothetical protein n=1 Tax=Aureivirga sp. CE67 TaxID=1788983 RepID=UPI0018CA48DB|nr:hypothetical protein [Aureivirga sp. CE67]